MEWNGMGTIMNYHELSSNYLRCSKLFPSHPRNPNLSSLFPALRPIVCRVDQGHTLRWRELLLVLTAASTLHNTPVRTDTTSLLMLSPLQKFKQLVETKKWPVVNLRLKANSIQHTNPAIAQVNPLFLETAMPLVACTSAGGQRQEPRRWSPFSKDDNHVECLCAYHASSSCKSDWMLDSLSISLLQLISPLKSFGPSLLSAHEDQFLGQSWMLFEKFIQGFLVLHQQLRIGLQHLPASLFHLVFQPKPKGWVQEWMDVACTSKCINKHIVPNCSLFIMVTTVSCLRCLHSIDRHDCLLKPTSGLASSVRRFSQQSEHIVLSILHIHGLKGIW